MPPPDKNTSVFLDGALPHVGDLSHAETRRDGEFFSRKERKDHKAGGPTSVSATIDRSGWKRVRLGEVCKPCRGVRVVRSQLSQGRYLVYQNSLIPLGHYDKCNTPANTTFVIAAGSAGEIGYCDEPFWAADDCFFLLPNQDVISKFLYYSLAAQQQHISGLVRRGSVPRLARDIMGNLVLTLPNMAEQEKIVRSLTAIDINISTIQSLVAKYEAIKKATVNLLLEPKADWRTSTMGESFDLSRGVVISKNEIERRPGIYPVYSSQSVNDGVLGLIDSYRYDGEYITWTTDGANAGTVFYRHGKFNCTNVCGIAKARIPKMSPAFVALMIAQYAKSYVSYVGNPKLMSNIFAQIIFSYPSASEQRKIAEKITAIDKVLADYKAQLEKARQLKAGMMSYFFG